MELVPQTQVRTHVGTNWSLAFGGQRGNWSLAIGGQKGSVLLGHIGDSLQRANSKVEKHN